MRGAFLLIGLIFATAALNAESFTWSTSAYTRYWDNATNWEGSIAPPLTDTETEIILTGGRNTTTRTNNETTIGTLTLDQNATRNFSVSGRALTIHNGVNNLTSNRQLMIQNYLKLPQDQTWTVNEGANIRITNRVEGSSILEKAGAGTLYLAGSQNFFNRFTGSIKITEGTVSLVRNGVMYRHPHLIMNGGTLQMNGYDDAAGTLTLTADSTIQFNTGTPYYYNGSYHVDDRAIMRFADSSATSWDPNATLYITDWDGSQYGGGNDQLIFLAGAGSLTAQQLAQIKFVDPGDRIGVYGATILTTGEVVPVPEPATMALGGALAGLLGLNERRRRKAKADQDEQA